MPDTTNQIDVCGSLVLNTTVFPDTVLQTLDRRVGKDDLFFGKEMFARSVKDWSGIPAIYQPDGIHPTDFTAVAADPEAAAKAVGGRLVGSVSNPRIVIPGGPRLMAELDIDEGETEIVELWKKGRLFPSTAFTASSDGDRLVSAPVPNHVLLFPARTDVVVPGDPGAFVNTYEVSNNMTRKEDETKTCNAELPVDLNTADITEAADEIAGELADKAGDAAELMNEIAALKTDLEALRTMVAGLKPVTNAEPADERAKDNPDPETAGLRKENEALRAELESLKKQLDDQKSAAEKTEAELNSMLSDAKFNRILDRMPPGAKATEAQLDSMRKAFDAGDIETILNTVFALPRGGATRTEGVPFVQSQSVERPDITGVGDLSRPLTRKDH